MEKDVESIKIDYPLEKGVIVGVCIKTEKLDNNAVALQTSLASNFNGADLDDMPLDPVGLLALKVFMDAIGKASDRLKEIHELIGLLKKEDDEDSAEEDSTDEDDNESNQK